MFLIAFLVINGFPNTYIETNSSTQKRSWIQIELKLITIAQIYNVQQYLIGNVLL